MEADVTEFNGAGPTTIICPITTSAGGKHLGEVDGIGLVLDVGILLEELL
jgi:hypothetical protein